MKIYKEANLGKGEVYTHQTNMNFSIIPPIAWLEETCLFENNWLHLKIAHILWSSSLLPIIYPPEIKIKGKGQYKGVYYSVVCDGK